MDSGMKLLELLVIAGGTLWYLFSTLLNAYHQFPDSYQLLKIEFEEMAKGHTWQETFNWK